MSILTESFVFGHVWFALWIFRGITVLSILTNLGVDKGIHIKSLRRKWNENASGEADGFESSSSRDDVGPFGSLSKLEAVACVGGQKESEEEATGDGRHGAGLDCVTIGRRGNSREVKTDDAAVLEC